MVIVSDLPDVASGRQSTQAVQYVQSKGKTGGVNVVAQRNIGSGSSGNVRVYSVPRSYGGGSGGSSSSVPPKLVYEGPIEGPAVQPIQTPTSQTIKANLQAGIFGQAGGVDVVKVIQQNAKNQRAIAESDKAAFELQGKIDLYNSSGIGDRAALEKEVNRFLESRAQLVQKITADTNATKDEIKQLNAPLQFSRISNANKPISTNPMDFRATAVQPTATPTFLGSFGLESTARATTEVARGAEEMIIGVGETGGKILSAPGIGLVAVTEYLRATSQGATPQQAVSELPRLLFETERAKRGIAGAESAGRVTAEVGSFFLPGFIGEARLAQSALTFNPGHEREAAETFLIGIGLGLGGKLVKETVYAGKLATGGTPVVSEVFGLIGEGVNKVVPLTFLGATALTLPQTFESKQAGRELATSFGLFGLGSKFGEFGYVKLKETSFLGATQIPLDTMASPESISAFNQNQRFYPSTVGTNTSALLNEFRTTPFGFEKDVVAQGKPVNVEQQKVTVKSIVSKLPVDLPISGTIDVTRVEGLKNPETQLLVKEFFSTNKNVIVGGSLQLERAMGGARLSRSPGDIDVYFTGTKPELNPKLKGVINLVPSSFFPEVLTQKSGPATLLGVDVHAIDPFEIAMQKSQAAFTEFKYGENYWRYGKDISQVTDFSKAVFGISGDKASFENVSLFQKTAPNLQGAHVSTKSAYSTTAEPLASSGLIEMRSPKEGGGLFVSPDLSIPFLRLGKSTDYSFFGGAPIEPTVFVPTFAGPERFTRIPSEYRGSMETATKFMFEGASKKGYAYISPMYETGLKTEKEAIIPTGTKYSQIFYEKKPLRGFEYYTTVGGTKVPIKPLAVGDFTFAGTLEGKQIGESTIIESSYRKPKEALVSTSRGGTIRIPEISSTSLSMALVSPALTISSSKASSVSSFSLSRLGLGLSSSSSSDKRLSSPSKSNISESISSKSLSYPSPSISIGSLALSSSSPNIPYVSYSLGSPSLPEYSVNYSRPSIVPPIRPPIRPPNTPPGLKKKKRDEDFPIFRNTTRAYTVLGRRRGKVIVLGAGLPIGRATALGVNFARSTLGRSFKTVAVGQTSMQDIGFQTPTEVFRPARSKALSGFLVQKAKYALSSPYERMEIRQSRRSRRSFL